MRKFFKLFFLVLLLAISCLVWGFFLIGQGENHNFLENIFFKVIGPCRKPLEFSVGEIDQRFEIPKDDVINLSVQASKIWNEAAGKEVLAYNPEASFKINLIFDERQVQTIETERLKKDLEDLKSSQEQLLEEYQTSNDSYKKMVEKYNSSLIKYEKKLKAYNKEVNYWNEKGGAPEDEYAKLEEEKKELKKDYANIEKQRKAINNLAEKTNDFAVKEKQLISDYNAELITYKSEFGEAKEFEKGVFDGSAINIFQFQRVSDLKLTLIHELGHYLSLGHTENSQSIMYYMIGDQSLANPTLTEEDKKELKKVCKM